MVNDEDGQKAHQELSGPDFMGCDKVDSVLRDEVKEGVVALSVCEESCHAIEHIPDSPGRSVGWELGSGAGVGGRGSDREPFVRFQGEKLEFWGTVMKVGLEKNERVLVFGLTGGKNAGRRDT